MPLKGTWKRAWNSQTSRKKWRSTLAQGHRTDKDTSEAFTAKSTATDSHWRRERLLTEGSWSDCEGRYCPEPHGHTHSRARTHKHTGFIKLINQDDNRRPLGEETSEQEGWWDENTREAQVHPSHLQLTCLLIFLYILNASWEMFQWRQPQRWELYRYLNRFKPISVDFWNMFFLQEEVDPL